MSGASDVSTVPYVLLGNGRVAAGFLDTVPSAPVAVVLNAPDKQRNAADVRAAARDRMPVMEWSPETRKHLADMLRERSDLWLLSVYFGHPVDREVLEAARGKAVNLHPSLLPWNRGVHTNVWPIVEGTPAGVTLHAMNETIDGGAILAQSEVPVRPWDSAASLYDRLEIAASDLLAREWPGGVIRRWPGEPQPGGGSTHRLRDFARLSEYDLDAHPEARAFFDLVRARSFPPYPGLIVRRDGRRVEATLVLREVPDA